MARTRRHQRKNRHDEAAFRKFALSEVLEITDRILSSGSPIKVEITTSSRIDAPAWTDGEKIYLNSRYDPLQNSLKTGFTTRSMLIATALNYHELGHCMLSPRIDSPLIKRVQKIDAFLTANILEDQAAETRFVKLYNPARLYFTGLVTEFMLNQSSVHMSQNYVLVSGRLFIPNHMRERLKARFWKPELIDDIDALVAAYKPLVAGKDDDEMFRIIKELHELIGRNTLLSSRLGDELKASHSEMTASHPSQVLTEELSRISEFIEKGDGFEEPQREDEAAGEEAESADQRKGEGEDAQAPDTAATTTEKGDKDLLTDVLKDVERSIEQELDSRIDSVQQRRSNYRAVAKSKVFKYVRPSVEDRALVQRCRDEFVQLRQQALPGWHQQQRQGKLNPRHYARAFKGDEMVYRKWFEGIHDAFDFEIVISLDMSSSMKGRIERASRALWVLQRMFEELDGSVTSLGFADHPSILSPRHERTVPHKLKLFEAYGNTHVNPALNESRRLLNSSRRRETLAIIITDGQFSDTTAALDTLLSFDHDVAIIGIQLDVGQYRQRKNVIHTETIQEPSELVTVVRNLALSISGRYIQERG